ncbi:MAG: DUF6782 family putative metallopeptidase [Candidatus Promineifilaceae bacterium]
MQSRHTLLAVIAISILLPLLRGLAPLTDEALSAPLAIEVLEAVMDLMPGKPMPSDALLVDGIDKEQFRGIYEVLNEIDTGRATLALIERYSISISFEAEGGTRFNPTTNQIIMKRGYDTELAALALIHEAKHARYHLEGTAADVRSHNRETYVAMKVREEAEAIAADIEAKIELEALASEQDLAESTGPHPKLEDIYRSAYESAGEAAEAGDHGLSDETLKTIARNSAKQEVFEALMEFKAVTSNTRKTYPFKWGEYWDEMNDHGEG